MKLHNKKQKGFTLIEVLVAIAIAAIATIAVGSTIERANVASLTAQLVDDISLVRGQAVVYRGANLAYTGTTIASMAAIGLFDASDVDATGLLSPTGGHYTAAVNGTNTNELDITADGIEDEVCEGLIHRFTESSVSATCATGTFTLTVR